MTSYINHDPRYGETAIVTDSELIAMYRANHWDEVDDDTDSTGNATRIMTDAEIEYDISQHDVELLPNDPPSTPQYRVILDDGGGTTLQLGEWAHHYDYPDVAAQDITRWLYTGLAPDDGHEIEALVCNPTREEITNGGYRIITLTRRITPRSLARRLRHRASDWHNATQLARSLVSVQSRKEEAR